MTRKFVSAAAFLLLSTIPEVAQACSVLSGEEQARRDAALSQYLHRYSDFIVFGRWVESDAAQSEDFIEGRVVVSATGGVSEYPVDFGFLIDCNRRPRNGEVGTFYIRADINDPSDFSPSGLNLLTEGVQYNLIYFKPLPVEDESQR